MSHLHKRYDKAMNAWNLAAHNLAFWMSATEIAAPLDEADQREINQIREATEELRERLAKYGPGLNTRRGYKACDCKPESR